MQRGKKREQEENGGGCPLERCERSGKWKRRKVLSRKNGESL